MTHKELVSRLLPTGGFGDAYNRIEVYTVGANGVPSIIELGLQHEADMTEIPVADIRLIRTVEEYGHNNGAGGGAVTSTNTTYTGSGVLGGSGAGSVHGGNQRPILSGTGLHRPAPDNHTSPNPNNDDPGGSNDTAGKTETAPANETADVPQAVTVWVETRDDGDRYELCAAEGEKSLQDLGGHVSVTMTYELPLRDTGKALYAVFRNADGTLTALRARYSRVKGELRFEADRLGLFVVVALDCDGEEFSDAFDAALEELPALQRLG